MTGENAAALALRLNTRQKTNKSLLLVPLLLPPLLLYRHMWRGSRHWTEPKSGSKF